VANSESFPGLTQEDCDTVFMDYVLVDKTKKELIEKNVKEAAAQPAQQVEKSTLGDLDVLQELKDKMEKEQ